VARVVRAAIVGLCLVGCTVPTVDSQTSAIRGGTTDDGDPAVVALSVLGVYSYCTATLIAPKTILTAGHCVLTGMEADFGTDADNPTQSIDVKTSVRHPMYSAEGAPYDFALMQLASVPTGVTPIALDGSALGEADLGRTIRHVGYGVTDDSTSAGGGTRRTVSYTINKIDDMLVYSGAQGEQTCTGDSGGPGLVMTGAGEVIATVTSDGPDCQLSQDGWDDRVDLVQDWIVATVSMWDTPPTFVTETGSGSNAGSASGSDAGSGSSDGTADSGADPAGGCSATHTSAAWLAFVVVPFARRRRRLA
jgi:secreted trypsin-like serine protease